MSSWRGAPPSFWLPSPSFRWLLIPRLCGAIFMHISDCDETYNYWEPAHHLLYGGGLQTWEYSPTYTHCVAPSGLSTYPGAYLHVHSRGYHAALKPMLVWILVFFTRAHKEEKFLFPIYPLLCLCAAITVYLLPFPVSDCHCLVDLDLPKTTPLQPRYAQDTTTWDVLVRIPFLDTSRSHRLYRAFAIPWLSQKYTSYVNYVLLKNRQLFGNVKRNPL